MVELSVALHYVFDTPRDKLVWDVGHQSYIHKILTERASKFPNIRQLGGISGFPSRRESRYDPFGAGHAGTSISAALGLLEAEHLKESPNRVVAIIGDGALTSGMAFEALNHAGQLKRHLALVLNDNEMSIAPNVGALSRAFSQTLTNKFSTHARRYFRNLVEKGIVPKTFYRILDKAEDATQGFFSTPAMLFESFDFRYIGPIDGHNIDGLIYSLERLKEQDGPTVLHVQTQKGRGYAPAEEDPVSYHGIPPLIKKKDDSAKTYTQVFSSTILELARADERILAITAAMPDGTGLKELSEELPEQFYDVGIAEEHAVTFAAGLACEGFRPFCAIYSTFLQRAYDQILHDVCLQSLPVVFAIDRAGLVGEDGPTHQGLYDIGYLRTMPNMALCSPKDELELRDLLHTAASYEAGPFAIRYPRGRGRGLELGLRAPQTLDIGSAELLYEARRGAGTSVLVIALGRTVWSSLEAIRSLEKEEIYSSLINARFVKPLDRELLRSEIAKAELVVTVEDAALQGGFGSCILEFAADEGLLTGRRFSRIGVGDFFVEHGKIEQQSAICGIDSTGIAMRIRHFFRAP